MSYVYEIIMQKNMFGCPQKFILIIYTFLLENKNIDAQSCEKSLAPHELSYV